MKEFEKDPKLEQIVNKLKSNTPPENIMQNYVDGVHSKIVSREQAWRFTMLIIATSVTAAIILTVFVVVMSRFQVKRAPAKPAMVQAAPLTIGTEMLPGEVKQALSATESPISSINRDIDILQALGEDPSGEIINLMDSNQLAGELNYCDKIEIDSYEQPAAAAPTP